MPEENPSKSEFSSEDQILRLDQTLPADVNEIDPVAQRIMGIVSSMECGSGKEFEIETALREALANAVVHGCKGDPRKKIQVAVGCDESRGMLIIVRDPGSGFDPRDIPSPTTGQNVYRAHGRGIYLINELMDEVRFEKGGTEIWMKKL
jgi:serine/threonine-protein kinase RsbW